MITPLINNDTVETGERVYRGLMISRTAAAGLLTLTDIATLAGVRRPVVSAWRARPCAAGAFPAAVRTVSGVEHFEAAAVVRWLQASGRGNNQDPAADVALHLRPPAPTPEGMRLAAALVAARALRDEPLEDYDAEDLVELAHELDPQDLMLATEIAAADDELVERSAQFVDALMDSSYGPGDAMRSLVRDPRRFAGPAREDEIVPEVRAFVAQVAHALAAPVRAQGPCCLVDPTGCAEDLLLEITGVDGASWRDPVRMRPARAGEEAVRQSWRLVSTHLGVPEAARVDEEGVVDVDEPGVLVARLPHHGTGRMTPHAVLDAIDDIAVRLRPSQRVVVVAPASVLVDALPDTGADTVRHAVMSTGRLRAVVRLGHRVQPARGQERLALWVLGPQPTADFRQVGRTAVADLSAMVLDEVADDLVADIVAAIEDVVPRAADGRPLNLEGRAHAFRVARYQRTSDLLAERGDLVPRDLRPLAVRAPRTDAEPRAERAAAAAAGVSVPVAAVPVLVDNRPADEDGVQQTVRVLVDSGHLALLSGVRLAPGEVHAGPGPRVVGTPELSGERRPGDRATDLLTFTATHPRAARTQPGDVVFAPGPHGGAWVDQDGGSVIEAPARVLRVVGADRSHVVVPHILAADLAGATSAAWRATVIRLVPAEVAPTLTTTLAAVQAARDAALGRAAQLARLVDTLADGACAGELTAMLDPATTEGR